MAATATTQSQTRAKPGSGAQQSCGCGCGCAKQTCSCELTCFVRPEYHCGHLLTDADLSLQLQYLVEKNKLRNRSLHGHGVVCGLKMTCDPNCCDRILVHKGYAIDACGNDIVLCETTCFDVFAALRAKNLIGKPVERDRCKPEIIESECKVPQCFYITLCYEEQKTDFETPFQTACSTGPQDCVPTRIKEGFRLDVTDELPEQFGKLEQLEKKLKRSFRLFLDSPVGRMIKNNLLRLKQIAAGKAEYSQGDEDENCRLFCLLKAQFGQQLKQYPDELSCGLTAADIFCPDERGDNYQSAMKEAFARLFELMHRYQYDRVLAELVFSCDAPKSGGCIVLGCVEVDDCCVLRISNMHRGYVWSFANILEILTTTILTAKIEASEREADPHGPQETVRANSCCDDFVEFNDEAFLNEFDVNPAGRYLAASAPVRALREIHKSLAQNFAFADSLGFSPALFTSTDTKLLDVSAASLGLRSSSAESQVELAPLNLLQAVLSQSLMRRNDALRFYPGADGSIRAVTPDYKVQVPSPERSSQPDESSTEALRAVIAKRDKTIAGFQSKLTDLENRIKKLEPTP